MGAIKVSGMNSGMDTDAIVQALVEAQSKKVKTAKKEQLGARNNCRDVTLWRLFFVNRQRSTDFVKY